MTQMTVAEIAGRLGAVVDGDPQRCVTGVAGVREASHGDLTFIVGARYESVLARSEASAVLAPVGWSGACSGSLIRVEDPERSMEQVAEWFAPPPVETTPGIHITALVHASAEVADSAAIGPYCIVEANAVVGPDCMLAAGCYVGHRARLGAGCRLYPYVSLREDVIIGDRAIIHNGVVIGCDGYGYRVEHDDGLPVVEKIPQRGTVIIGDDVEIGANTTIDRARFGATRIGNFVKIDNLVQVAHNVTIGDYTGLAAQVGISGSTEVGSRTILRGQVGVTGHIRIGDDVIVGGAAAVTKSIPDGSFFSGDPARPHEQTTMVRAHLWRLPKLRERVGELETRLVELERRLTNDAS